MVNKLISVLLFAVWFRLFNVFFYSFFDIPVEFVTGEGISQFKLYWIVLFMLTTFAAYKTLYFLYHFNSKRVASRRS